MEQAHAAFDDFDSFFSAGPDWAELPLSPAMDMRDRGGYYELTLALPNATPESLDVQLNGRQLSIASRQEEQTAHSTSRHSFQSHLLLPGPVDSSVPVLITNEHNRMYIRVAKPGAAMPDTTQGEQP